MEAVVLADTGGKSPAFRVRFQTVTGDQVTTETSYALEGASVGSNTQVEYDPGDTSTVAQVGARSGASLLYGGFGVVGVDALAYVVWARQHPPGRAVFP